MNKYSVFLCLLLLAAACAAPPAATPLPASPATAWREVDIVRSARGEHDWLAAPLQALADDAAAPQPWSYRVYLPVDAAAQTDARPLILLNLLASIEWDADDAYINNFKQALHEASFYLWDFTDGHMAIGQARVVDNRESWGHADIRVLARNTEAPHASIGGITEQTNPSAYRVQVGPFWSSKLGTDPQGVWSAVDGHRTLGHELAHYVLGLYDEYNLDTKSYSGCSAAPPDDSANLGASVMNWQYTASELSSTAVPRLWSSECEKTLHWQKKQQGAWESIAARLNPASAAWKILTPDQTPHPGPGKGEWPAALAAVPAITSVNSTPAPLLADVSVKVTGGPPNEAVPVSLARPGQDAISLGNVVIDELLPLLGAHSGDTLFVKYKLPSDAVRFWCGTATLSDAQAVSVTVQLTTSDNSCPFRFKLWTNDLVVAASSQARGATARPSPATGAMVWGIETRPDWQSAADIEPMMQALELEPLDSPQWAADAAAALAAQGEETSPVTGVGLCLPERDLCTQLPIGVASYTATEERYDPAPLTYASADGRLQVYDRADPGKIQSLLILDSPPPLPYRELHSVSRAYTLAGEWQGALQVQIQTECCLDASAQESLQLARLQENGWIEMPRPLFFPQESYALVCIAEPGTYALFSQP